MIKVYIVKAPQGEYEDYQEPIVKVFASLVSITTFTDISIIKDRLDFIEKLQGE